MNPQSTTKKREYKTNKRDIMKSLKTPLIQRKKNRKKHSRWDVRQKNQELDGKLKAYQ